MKIFWLLVLCLHLLSCCPIDCSFVSEIDHDSKYTSNDEASEDRYDSVSQSLESYKYSQECVVRKGNNKKIYKAKDGISNSVRGTTEELNKNDAAINSFLNYHFPPYYHTYNFSTQEELRTKRRLDIIEKSVNIAVSRKNQTMLKESNSEYILLLAKYGPIARLYIQIAECIALIAKIIGSKPTFDSAMNLFNEVMLFTELSETHFTLVAKRRVAFLSLREDFNIINGVQKKLVAQFPQNKQELNKLAEIQYAFTHTLDVMDVFERVVKLDLSNEFATVTFSYMHAYTELNISTKLLIKFWDLKNKLQKILYSKGFNKNKNYINIDSDPGILKDLNDGAELMLRAIGAKSPGIMTGMYPNNAVLSGALIYECGDALKRLERNEEAYTIFELAARDGLFQRFWKRSANFMIGLTARTIWNIDQTGIAPLLHRVQNQWENIRDEAFSIIKRKLFKPQEEGITKRGKWGVYDLYHDGIRIEDNCLNAPLTCSLIEKIPQISDTIRGRVKFSIMEAGTHVASHSGPSNFRIRIHLGLKIPPIPSNVTSTANSPCRARVVNEYFTWGDGKINIFDDSFDHEVWQLDPLKRSRLILIMDMAHPELTN